MTPATGTPRATASLSGHGKGSVQVTRKQLAGFPAPKSPWGGPYHKPVAHIELIETLEARLKELLKAKITSEQYAVRANKMSLFGVLTLDYGEQKDLTAAIGIRHSNNGSMAMQFVAGMSVFVCDNMALRGDVIFLKKRHTINLNLAAEIDEGIKKFEEHYKQLTGEVKALKQDKIADEAAKVLMFDGFTKNNVMPLRLLPVVAKEYFEPRHREFEPRTAWSLYNAFTEVAKQLPMTTRMEATQELGQLFGLTDKK